MTPRILAVVLIVLASGSTACTNWDIGMRPDEVHIGGKDVNAHTLPPPPFGEITKPGTIYVERSPVYTANEAIPMASRYVLYDDGTFGLQTSSAAQAYEYRGRFTRADSLITFDWDGWSAAGPWEASAILRGDELIVTYGFIMQMTDFVDATYFKSGRN